MSMPLVSIGIPCYNRPKGLMKSLENIVNQTYSNIEIIISDNCSENNEVKEIAERYAQSDNRIKYIRQSRNIGMYDNFNFVLEHSTGEFFMWASDDDIFAPEMIETCLPYLLEQPTISLCAPHAQIYDTNGEEISKFKPDFHTVGLTKIERLRKIAFYIKKSHAAMYGLFRTSTLKKIKVQTHQK